MKLASVVASGLCCFVSFAGFAAESTLNPPALDPVDGFIFRSLGVTVPSHITPGTWHDCVEDDGAEYAVVVDCALTGAEASIDGNTVRLDTLRYLPGTQSYPLISYIFRGKLNIAPEGESRLEKGIMFVVNIDAKRQKRHAYYRISELDYREFINIR